MLKFALCDDEPFWLEKIMAYFETRDDIEVLLSCYNSGDSLIKAYQHEHVCYDALFLDMEMPGLNGLETAKAIRAMGCDVVIVFVTSYDQYAVEGYEYEVFGYLLKPNLDEKLPRTVYALVDKLNSQRTSIVIKTSQGEINIGHQEILYCEKNGHYIEVCTKRNIYKTRMSMSDFEKMLRSKVFVRCHNSFMVNLSNVRNLTEKNVIMQRQGLELPIGRGFKVDLRKAWNEYLKKEAGL